MSLSLGVPSCSSSECLPFDRCFGRSLARDVQADLPSLHSEADVFLEQRSLHDVQRNAMVSVFLRVLEYHSGVLFLTTNRIRTVDEAFLSRFSMFVSRLPELGRSADAASLSTAPLPTPTSTRPSGGPSGLPSFASQESASRVRLPPRRSSPTAWRRPTRSPPRPNLPRVSRSSSRPSRPSISTVSHPNRGSTVSSPPSPLLSVPVLISLFLD